MAQSTAAPPTGARLLAVPGQEDNFILYNYLVKQFVDDGWHNFQDFDRVLSNGQVVTGTDGKQWLKATGFNGDSASFTGYVYYEDRDKTWYNLPTVQTPPLETPTNFTAMSVSSSQIRLAWKNENPNNTEIERSTSATGPFTKIAAPTAVATAFNDQNLSPNTLYFYRIRAVSSSGNSDYASVSNAMTLSIQDSSSTPSNSSGLTNSTNNSSATTGSNITQEAASNWFEQNKVIMLIVGIGLLILIVLLIAR